MHDDWFPGIMCAPLHHCMWGTVGEMNITLWNVQTCAVEAMHGYCLDRPKLREAHRYVARRPVLLRALPCLDYT